MSDSGITNMSPPDRRPLGPPSLVVATSVLEGEFTTATGLRLVTRTEHVMFTSGRGKKKMTTMTGVRFYRVDGTFDEVLPDADVLVRRRISA